MKVAVVGSRHYTNKAKLFNKLDQYEIDMIISGGAKGADTLLPNPFSMVEGLQILEHVNYLLCPT